MTDDSESLVHFIFIIISLPRKMSPRLIAYTHISYFQTSHHTKVRASTHLQYISRDGKYHVLKLSLRSFPLPKKCALLPATNTHARVTGERGSTCIPRGIRNGCARKKDATGLYIGLHCLPDDNLAERYGGRGQCVCFVFASFLSLLLLPSFGICYFPFLYKSFGDFLLLTRWKRKYFGVGVWK